MRRGGCWLWRWIWCGGNGRGRRWGLNASLHAAAAEHIAITRAWRQRALAACARHFLRVVSVWLGLSRVRARASAGSSPRASVDVSSIWTAMGHEEAVLQPFTADSWAPLPPWGRAALSAWSTTAWPHSPTPPPAPRTVTSRLALRLAF